MTVWDDLHARARLANVKGTALYLSEDERADLDAADPYLVSAVEASGYDIQVDDAKAATQAKAAAKAYPPEPEPDLPGVTAT